MALDDISCGLKQPELEEATGGVKCGERNATTLFGCRALLRG